MTYERFRRSIAALVVGLSLMFAGQVADGAEPAIAGHTISGELDFGGRQIYGERKSSKFNEYRDIDNGFFVDLLELMVENKEQSRFYLFRAKDVLEDDQSYLLRMGRYGKYELELGWDENTQVFSNSARTLYITDGDKLRIPALVRTSLQGASSPLDTATIRSTINDNVRSIPLELDHEKASVKFKYNLAPGWDFRFNYDFDSKEGTRPFSPNVKTNSTSVFNSVELPKPIDWETHNISFSLERAAADWSAQLGYAASIFKNDNHSFLWDNPFRTTDSATLGPAQARSSELPDNIAHNFTFNGALNLPLNARLMATLGYGMMRQDDRFLPPTTNSLLTTSALPGGSADAKIDTFLMNYVLNAPLGRVATVTARYRYYDVNNKTSEMIFLDYAEVDSALATTDRRNLAVGYTKQNAGVDVNWRFIPRVSVKTGFGWERWDRDRADAKETNEYSGKLSVDYRPTNDILLRGSYLRAQRRYQKYDNETNVHLRGFPTETVGSADQQPTARKFFMADRDRNEYSFLSQFNLTDTLTLAVTAAVGDDNFKSSDLGVTNDDRWDTTVEVTYTPTPGLSLFAYYTHEDFKMVMRSRQSGGSLGNTPDNDWESTTKDIVDTVGLGLDKELIPKRLDLRLSYSYSAGIGKTDSHALSAANNISIEDFPDTKNRLHQFKSDLKYRLGKNFTVKFSYIYERYLEDDFATDKMQPYMVDYDSGASQSIFMGVTRPDYEAHFVGLSFRWTF